MTRSHFAEAVAAYRIDPAGRRWIYVPYDQLTSAVGPLHREDPHRLGIVMVECPAKAARRPYHQHKLALVLANGRQFALEQAARGIAVRHVVARASVADALATVIAELGPLHMMEAAERELRHELEPLRATGALTVEPHAGWLTGPADFTTACGTPPWRMDGFYRHVRRRYDILMDRGKPRGGKWSFDADNRRPWSGDPPAPTPPTTEPDAITQEVIDLVRTRYGHHPGAIDPQALPTTHADAERAWRWALSSCLPWFGPYEDAMSRRSSGLFHTRIAALLNLHRLLPARVVADAIASAAPLASVEGFVRQIVGWREYVRHVHRATDGFRELPGHEVSTRATPGDGGWSRWSARAWPGAPGDGGACPSRLGAARALPPALWGTPSGLACLDHVVADTWREAWGHHITRLMVVANIMTLLDVSPRELTDWFWVAYADAYDWVVEPNVLAMGTFAVGDLATTKPYVSGAPYLAKMSDHCRACAFDPRRDCPITPMYWAYLARHADALAGNQRLAVPLAALRKRSAAARQADAATFERVSAAFTAGERVDQSTTTVLTSLAPPRS